MELRYIGGIYGGNVKPTPFLSLLLNILLIQPEKEIVVEFIKNEDFKLVLINFFAYYLEPLIILSFFPSDMFVL